MGEVVNLRRVRKVKAREAEAVKAAENRAVSGRTKAERDAAKAEKHATDRALDAARIERD